MPHDRPFSLDAMFATVTINLSFTRLSLQNSMKLIISLLFLSSVFSSANQVLGGNTLPLDLLSSIPSFLSRKEQNAFINISSKDLNHSFIQHALETSKGRLTRAQSLQIVRYANLRKIVEEKYKNLSIYPVTLTFHQDDVPLLQTKEVFSFIRRVHIVVFDQTERLIIEAVHLDVPHGDNQRSIEMYNPNSAIWTWKQPEIMELLDSEIVTAVKSLSLRDNKPLLSIEQSWSVTEGDMKWTGTKTSHLQAVQGEGISSSAIIGHNKMRSLRTLTVDNLVEFSVLTSLTKLESLFLQLTFGGSGPVANESASELLVLPHQLKNLTNLKVLHLNCYKFETISALKNLTNLKFLNLGRTQVRDFSVLAELKSLKYLNLHATNIADVSVLANLTNLRSLNLSGTDFVDRSALANLTNLVVHG